MVFSWHTGDAAVPSPVGLAVHSEVRVSPTSGLALYRHILTPRLIGRSGQVRVFEVGAALKYKNREEEEETNVWS